MSTSKNALPKKLREHFTANGFPISNLSTKTNRIYWAKRIVADTKGADDETLNSAADRFGQQLLSATSGFVYEDKPVNFRLMSSKVEKYENGKVAIMARIKVSDGEQSSAANSQFVPEFDLDGNIVNAPSENQTLGATTVNENAPVNSRSRRNGNASVAVEEEATAPAF